MPRKFISVRKASWETTLQGCPFPLLDPNDPQVATKVMWNFSHRPQYSDDADIREVEGASYLPGGTSKEPVEHFMFGHFQFYNNVGRTEVQPIPTDPEAQGPGIRYRFAAFPMLEPMEMLGFGIVRLRYRDPGMEDNVWLFNPGSGRARRVRAEELSDSMPHVGSRTGATSVVQSGPTYVNTLDPDSFFGFSAKVEDYTYRLIGIKPMVACVEASSAPAAACQYDGARTICPENWEIRQLYVVEATAKPLSWHQRIGSAGVLIPKRILYIDSEGWFITASDQFDNEGKLRKTIATFNAYRDRPVPDARVAIFPFNRMFQTALVDEDLQTGVSTVLRMPGAESQDHESWYINMGIATKAFIDPHQMAIQGRY